MLPGYRIVKRFHAELLTGNLRLGGALLKRAKDLIVGRLAT